MPQTDRQADKQTDIQTDTQTDTQTSRQTNRQTSYLTCSPYPTLLQRLHCRIRCLCDVVAASDRIGHPSPYAEAKKMKSLTLPSKCCLLRDYCSSSSSTEYRRGKRQVNHGS